MAVGRNDLRMKICQVDWYKNKMARMLTILTRKFRLNKVLLKLNTNMLLVIPYAKYAI